MNFRWLPLTIIILTWICLYVAISILKCPSDYEDCDLLWKVVIHNSSEGNSTAQWETEGVQMDINSTHILHYTLRTDGHSHILHYTLRTDRHSNILHYTLRTDGHSHILHYTLLFSLKTKVLDIFAQDFAWPPISPSPHQTDFACITNTNIWKSLNVQLVCHSPL